MRISSTPSPQTLLACTAAILLAASSPIAFADPTPLTLSDVNVSPLLLDSKPSTEAVGPVTVNGHDELPWIKFDMPTGSLDFKHFYNRDQTNQAGVGGASTTNTFQESVTPVSQGFLFSPNLADIKVGATVGLEQDLYDATGNNQNSNSVLYGWDVSSVFLRNETTPVTVYARRTVQYVTPDFSPALQDTDTIEGISLLYRDPSLPTQLEYYHDDDEQLELVNGANNFHLNQDVFHWHTDAVALPHQSLAVDYSFRNTAEKEGGSANTNYQTHDASLTHVWSFGHDYASSLTSAALINVETGQLVPYQRYRLDESLQLQHTRDFATHYDYTVEDEESQGITQVINSLDAGFDHRLFKSLVTRGDIGGSLDDETSAGATQTAFARLDTSYHKLVP